MPSPPDTAPSDAAPHAATDTATRSLAHWSEAGRAEMDAFYALATEDYRHLALAADWASLLRARAEGWRCSTSRAAAASSRRRC